MEYGFYVIVQWRPYFKFLVEIDLIFYPPHLGDSNKENEKTSGSSEAVDTSKQSVSEEASKRLFGEAASADASQAESSQNTAENNTAPPSDGYVI